MGKTPPPPRIYGIIATEAPVAVIFRRGPSEQWCVLMLDLQSFELTVLGWRRGSFYPRRCDISPDGKYLCIVQADWSARGRSPYDLSDSWADISEIPSLEGTAGWPESGMYTRGYRFGAPTGPVGERDREVALPNGERFIMKSYDSDLFALERSHGWTRDSDFERASTQWLPPQLHSAVVDSYPESRVAVTRSQPQGESELSVISDGYHFNARQGQIEGVQSVTYLRNGPDRRSLSPEWIWADWSHDGKFVGATTEGTLELHQVQGLEMTFLRRHDLSTMRPPNEAEKRG